MSRESNVKAKLAKYGLRVVCLACGWEGRWYRTPEPRELCNLMGVPVRESRRLRDATCGRCNAVALRSRYWVEEHPDRAAVAADRVRSVQRAIR